MEPGQKLPQVASQGVGPPALDQLQTFVEELSAACRLTARDLSQFREALASANGEPGQPHLGDQELRPDATTSEYAYARLRCLFRDFLHHEPGTRLGEDPEELHQMRVAARRMRAVIRLFRPAIAPRFEYLEDELRWIARVLGEERDLQVQSEYFVATMRASSRADAEDLRPFVDGLKERIAQAQASVVEALDSARYQELVRDMTATLRNVYGEGDGASTPVRVFAARALRDRWRSVRKQASRIHDDSPSSDVHRLRIKGKRLRYALETFEPLFGRRTAKMIERTKDLQDILGEHQDHIFAIQWMRENAMRDAADLPPETLIQIGELIERRREEVNEIHGSWSKSYARVRKAWKRTKKEIKSELRDNASPLPRETVRVRAAPRHHRTPVEA
jgi:triphosphatase